MVGEAQSVCKGKIPYGHPQHTRQRTSIQDSNKTAHAHRTRTRAGMAGSMFKDAATTSRLVQLFERFLEACPRPMFAPLFANGYLTPPLPHSKSCRHTRCKRTYSSQIRQSRAPSTHFNCLTCRCSPRHDSNLELVEVQKVNKQP